MSDCSGIRGIVYDLDGTIIDSASVHVTAWRAAADKYGVEITPEFLDFQRGRTNEDAAKWLLSPLHRLAILPDIVREKKDYAAQHARESRYFEGFNVTYDWLRNHGFQVWICTSSPRRFCLNVYEEFDQLKDFVHRTVWREAYENNKAEGLGIAVEAMGLAPEDVIYVGDAPSDWEAAREARCRFVCYGGRAIAEHDELVSMLQ